MYWLQKFTVKRVLAGRDNIPSQHIINSIVVLMDVANCKTGWQVITLENKTIIYEPGHLFKYQYDNTIVKQLESRFPGDPQCETEITHGKKTVWYKPGWVRSERTGNNGTYMTLFIGGKRTWLHCADRDGRWQGIQWELKADHILVAQYRQGIRLAAYKITSGDLADLNFHNALFPAHFTWERVAEK